MAFPIGTAHIVQQACSAQQLPVAANFALLDYAFGTPADPLRSADCVRQRCALIEKNLEYMKAHK